MYTVTTYTTEMHINKNKAKQKSKMNEYTNTCTQIHTESKLGIMLNRFQELSTRTHQEMR